MATFDAPQASDHVQTLWSTRVWMGQLDVVLRDGAPEEMLLEGSPGDVARVDTEAVLADGQQVTEGLQGALSHLLPAVGRSWSIEIDLQVQVWSGGYSVGLAYGHGDWQGWCFLASNLDVDGPESGALTLHDPRAGCASVTVPGLPWGRPLTISPAPGLAVLHPGWLGYSILPVRADHRIAVLGVTARVGR